MEFHEKLKELRKTNGLTQEALAEKLFVTRAAISKWESGRGYPNIETLKAISGYFSISIDELLSGDELLTAAEAANRSNTTRLLERVYGILDCSIILLLFIPLFGGKIDGKIVSAPLLSLTGVTSYLKLLYYFLVLGTSLWGLLTLLLQCSPCESWHRMSRSVSLICSTAGVILFIASSQVYCACVLFVFLLIKAYLLIRKH